MNNIKFIGKDSESKNGRSPTLFVDEENGDLVIQGWKANQDTLSSCSEFGSLPEHEAIVRVPARMIDILRKACDVAESGPHQ